VITTTAVEVATEETIAVEVTGITVVAVAVEATDATTAVEDVEMKVPKIKQLNHVTTEKNQV